jgi:hypothetical protein
LTVGAEFAVASLVLVSFAVVVVETGPAECALALEPEIGALMLPATVPPVSPLLVPPVTDPPTVGCAGRGALVITAPVEPVELEPDVFELPLDAPCWLAVVPLEACALELIAGGTWKWPPAGFVGTNALRRHRPSSESKEGRK